MRKSSPRPPITEVEAALSIGGEMFPLTGRYTAKVWALLLGCADSTVRKYVQQYNIPYKQPGDEMIIDAVDFWNAMPTLRKSTTPSSRVASN